MPLLLYWPPSSRPPLLILSRLHKAYVPLAAGILLPGSSNKPSSLSRLGEPTVRIINAAGFLYYFFHVPCFSYLYTPNPCGRMHSFSMFSMFCMLYMFYKC